MPTSFSVVSSVEVECIPAGDSLVSTSHRRLGPGGVRLEARGNSELQGACPRGGPIWSYPVEAATARRGGLLNVPPRRQASCPLPQEEKAGDLRSQRYYSRVKEREGQLMVSETKGRVSWPLTYSLAYLMSQKISVRPALLGLRFLRKTTSCPLAGARGCLALP